MERNNFIYSEIIDEFRDYLDGNLSETIYFETQRLIKGNQEYKNENLSYKKFIRKDIFSFNSVLDNNRTVVLISDIKSLGKVKRYSNHAIEKLSSLTREASFDDRLNSIQFICSFSEFSNRHLLEGLEDENKDFPVSVLIPYQNFDILQSKTPFQELEKLVDIVQRSKKNQELYFSFITYYYSKENFSSFVKDISKRNIEKNQSAFLTAILYALTRRKNLQDIPYETDALIKAVKVAQRNIPEELDKKYSLIDQFHEVIG